MDNVLRIALVGCGGMAERYRKIYTQIKGAELALLVDVNQSLLERVSSELGGVKTSQSFSDCLSADIDMIDISTPNHLHYKQAIAALNANKHVLMQKPLASSAREAEEILSVSKSSNSTSGMFMYKLDNPVYHDVKEILARGLLGKITSTYSRNAHRGGLSIPSGTWRGSRRLTGGGSFIQLAIHDIHLLQWMLNLKIVRAMAMCKNLHCANIGGDDIASAVCEYNSGALATIESAFCANGSVVAIYGTEGSIKMEDEGALISIQANASFSGEVINYSTPHKTQSFCLSYKEFQSTNPHSQHVLFVNAAKNNAVAPVPLEYGVYGNKIAEAINKSALEGKAVYVS